MGRFHPFNKHFGRARNQSLSVCPFVCLLVSTLTLEFETKMKRAEKSNFQSEVFVNEFFFYFTHLEIFAQSPQVELDLGTPLNGVAGSQAPVSQIEQSNRAPLPAPPSRSLMVSPKMILCKVHECQ